jgi:preprotein translocase subunit SecF
MSRFGRVGHQLYTGELSYDFIGHRRRWYLISAILIVISIASLLIFHLQFGIEFKGGADFQVKTTVTAHTVPDMRAAIENSGVPDLQDSTINVIGGNQVRVQTRTLDPVNEVPKVRSAIAQEAGTTSENVAYSLIGASWGSQITSKAVLALVVFLILVTLVIWIYFRNGKMSAAALIALGHDLILTVGIYALVGFTVTPATLIGVLTILGYSLYDTVVVFDKVRENSRDLKSSSSRTYGEAANLAVNQVLVRSINTTVIGVLPVAALLFAGAFILGEGPLKDLALALFVGMVSGAYSSIFIATPLLVQMKEREPDMKKLSARVASRRARETVKAEPARVGAPVDPRPPTAGPSPAWAEADAEEDAGSPGLPRDETSAEAPLTLSVTRAPSAPPGSGHPVTDGVRRPQPQHKPRSQRKK